MSLTEFWWDLNGLVDVVKGRIYVPLLVFAQLSDIRVYHGHGQLLFLSKGVNVEGRISLGLRNYPLWQINFVFALLVFALVWHKQLASSSRGRIALVREVSKWHSRMFGRFLDQRPLHLWVFKKLLKIIRRNQWFACLLQAPARWALKVSLVHFASLLNDQVDALLAESMATVQVDGLALVTVKLYVADFALERLKHHRNSLF
jgi:hypothetical protein